jgi:hypothetical protein
VRYSIWPLKYGNYAGDTMTRDEKLRLIELHIMADRASSIDGKTSWDRVEDFRIKHGHLPGGCTPDRTCVFKNPESKIVRRSDESKA